MGIHRCPSITAVIEGQCMMTIDIVAPLVGLDRRHCRTISADSEGQ